MKVVTGLEDQNIVTIDHWPPLSLPKAEARSTTLSFDALAKLFAPLRTSLIDADLVSVDTRSLGSGPAPVEKHDD